MALFAVKDGLRLYNDLHESVDFLNGALDPSDGAGVAADVGSMYLRSDGSSYKKVGAADTDWQLDSADSMSWTTISGATNAEIRGGYVLDSETGAFTVTMPATPEIGDVVGFTGLGDIETNNVTIDFNGGNLHGSSDDLVIDLNYCYFDMMYSGDAATGWVLSNTDESGDIYNNTVNIATNSGNIATNASGIATNVTNISGLESRVTVNEGDIVTNASGIADNLAAIESNDIDIATNVTDITALETYTGSAGTSYPDYSNETYVADNDSLVVAVGKLDAALEAVSNVATTGVNWRQSIKAATAGVVDTGVAAYSGTDHMSDDDAPFWAHDAWEDGDQILSTISGTIYTWNDSSDKWDITGALGPNDAVSVRYDFLDNPGSQEDGAAYMMNELETEVVKIADFDLENAASIAISSGYTSTSGTISSADSVETAIEKLDFRSDASATDISDLDIRVTDNEVDIITNASGISVNASNISSNDVDISALDGRVTVNEGDIDDLEAAIGSTTGLAGMDYTSTEYVTTDSSVVDAISALDAALDTNATTVSGLNQNIINVDTAHDNLAAAVLIETSTVVGDSAQDVVLDTVTQAGNLGAKWFVVAYDGAGKRYACEIYAMHDGSTDADLTEYAILSIGTPKLAIDFDVVADGTNMTLVADNKRTDALTIKAQRATIQEVAVDTTAVLV